ncbi:MAG: dihydrolipoyl dehydrogenase [Spirochaetaceae bacterium]|jgi:dihydrolipoamide dehydrogenase|nr:dihydrolipoyl dehydrogenase [Spirochaetaceae bacterium]
MYDVIIIGGGPGGYLAGERLGHAKKKVLLVEEAHLGGTCLNVGCVPTKTLLHAAKLYVHTKEAARFGVTASGVAYDWAKIQAWKTEVAEKLRAGIAAQEKRLGVEVVSGRGEILARPSGSVPAKVGVTGADGKRALYEARAVLVSTGSAPFVPPIPGAKDNARIVDSTGLLSIQEVPRKLVIIGGGVIGVEFAGLFSSLGTEVAVIEMMDEIIPFMDKEIAPLYRKAMPGVEFKLGCKVDRIDGGTMYYTGKDGREEAQEGDVVLMAVGRRPVLHGWGAEAVGVGVTAKGVTVDGRMRTNIPGIWAAGDVTGLSLLAHSAYRMAEIAVAGIIAFLDEFGGKEAPNNVWRSAAVPWAVYGLPEAAGVGLTEQEAAAKGIGILKANVPLVYSGRFVAENTFTAPGVIKVIASAETRAILGVHAFGAYSSEFIWGAASLIENELRVEDVKELIFPHPTVGELIRDAVWML